MQFQTVPSSSIVVQVTALILFFGVPLILAIWWKIRKKEPILSILSGAAIFFLFALILEKPILTLVIVPDNALSRFIKATPLLYALVLGLFPGIFEETGRLVAFKFLLGKQKNRETAISYGLGHGGIEVILIAGMTYVNNLIYTVMINTGTFGSMVEQVKQVAPDQVETFMNLPEGLAALSFGTLALSVLERVVAMIFHIGCSILVFYACRDKKRFWLYPLAILLHTIMDGVIGLYSVGIWKTSVEGLEAAFALIAIPVFLGAYFLLYAKDRTPEPVAEDTEAE